MSHGLMVLDVRSLGPLNRKQDGECVGDVFVVTTQPCKRRRDEPKNPLQTPARWGCRENVFR